jgi:hypothetical protein
MSFIAQEKLCKHFAMAVEGDDGLTKGKFIESLTAQDFADLGFNVKIKKKTDIASASFCGIIYHPDDLVNVTDPREVLVSFGWANRRYSNARVNRLKALLRCKSLSYLHQYRGAPLYKSLLCMVYE